MASELPSSAGPVPLRDRPEDSPAWFRAFLAQLNSERTREEYGRWVRAFGRRVNLRTAKRAHVESFANAPGRSGKEPSHSTVNMRLAALDRFYTWALANGMVAENPAAGIPRKPVKPPTPQGLSIEEQRALLDAVPPTLAGLRDRAILVTLLLTGLRRSEVLGMRRGDLTVNGAVFYNVRIKGGAMKHRELPAPAFVAIREALEAQGRSLESLAPDDRLWDVQAPGFYHNLQVYGRKAGIVRSTKNPHGRLAALGIHVLRHTAAKNRRDAGESLEDVQQLLSHADLRTTARYLARLEGQEDKGWPAVAAALGLENSTG